MSKKIQKVIVGILDDVTKSMTITKVSEAMPGVQVIDGTRDEGIYGYLKNPENDVLLIFDRFFMGLILKYKMKFIRYLNPKTKIIFVEPGYCIMELGLRLWEVGADGFICDIEQENVFNNALNKILSGSKYFPEIVSDEIKTGRVIDRRRVSLELTDSEYTVALYLGKGFPLKEICYEEDMPYETVKTGSSAVKKKVGFKSQNDLIILVQRQGAFDVRSWNCS